MLSAIALMLLWPRGASAQWRSWGASADLDMDSQYVHNTRTGPADQRDGEAAISLVLRATGGKGAVQYGAGFSYRLGSSFPGGFLYGVELLPIGVGLVFSDRARLVVRAGGGVSGVTSRVPFAAELPVEGRLDLRVARWLAVGAFARLAWTTSSARERGVRVVDVGDELRAGVRVRVGTHYHHGRRMRGNDGYYLAALVSESVGSRFVGAAFGYSMDFVFGR